MEKTFIRLVKLHKGNYKISRKLYVLELVSMFVIGFVSGILAHSIMNKKQELSRYVDTRKLT